MPNYCNYSMRVVGRPEDVDFFIRELNQDYDYAYGVCNDIPVGMRHFCRVFEANESTSSIFREKIDKNNEIDCLTLFTLYKLGIDQEDIIKDVYKRYRNYCYTGKSCRNCKLLKFIHANFDNDNLPYCRSCYVVLYINDMLNLIGERK